MYAAADHMWIIALSGRALARSAVRGGYQAVVLDGFADMDTCAHAQQCVRVKTQLVCFDEQDLLRKVHTLAPREGKAGLVYGAGLESAANLLEELESYFRVCGNSADVAAAVNDPRAFIGLLDDLSVPHPEVKFSVAAANDSWLLKRAGATGGWHVKIWEDTSDFTSGRYLQQRLNGQAMSVLFIADGCKAVVVGFNTLWTQQHRSDATSFGYGGAINRADLSTQQRRALTRTIFDLVKALGLRGLNSLDFIKQDKQCYVLELNPRPSATFELYDPDVAGGLLNQHVRACQGRFTHLPHWRDFRVRAHAIVYAVSSLQIPYGLHWPPWCTDRPYAGTQIAAGEPVCGVVAEGNDPSRIQALVEQRRAELLSLFSRVCEAA